MNIKILLIVMGEPNTTFSELLMKYFNSNIFKKNKKKIILIGSKELFEKQCKILKQKINLKEIKKISQSSNKLVNIINVNYKFNHAFTKISKNSNNYINKCFNLSLKIIQKNKSIALLNGPVSKKHFLKKKFLGITEYVANKTKSNFPVMLIYNKTLSVSPLTTHTPIKNVHKFVTKKLIINNILKLEEFYKLYLNKSPKIAVLGLNPHCETIDEISEEKKEIKPAINILKKKKINVFGPFSADTFFLKKNIQKFDVVLGMYHDQVLRPIKTLFKFEAINITLGLPFIKVTPDHGPHHEMIGKNKSDASSIFYAFKFFNSIK